MDAVLKPSLTNSGHDILLTMTSGDVKKSNAKLALVGGIIALGIFASAIAGSQMLNANAQTSGGNIQKPITSADDQKTASVPVGNSFKNNDNRTTTVSTSGTASTKVKPDRVSITVGVETNSTTAQNATSANADTMANVMAALKKLGIADEQISTSNYNLYPVYGSNQPSTTDRPCIEIYPPPPGCQPNQQLVGYKATNSATVELDANGNVTAGSVIDAAVSAGANNVNGAFFFLSQDKQQQVRDSLIQDAIANARHRAEVAAGAVGMQVSGVQSISLSDVQFPAFARSIATSSPETSTEILSGAQEVTTSVNVTFYMNGNTGNNTSTGGETEDRSTEAVAIARQFILSKLPSLGIKINNELDLHSDMVVKVSDKEYSLEYSVLDTNKQSHDGHIEVVDGKVTVATLDGKSIL